MGNTWSGVFLFWVIVPAEGEGDGVGESFVVDYGRQEFRQDIDDFVFLDGGGREEGESFPVAVWEPERDSDSDQGVDDILDEALVRIRLPGKDFFEGADRDMEGTRGVDVRHGVIEHELIAGHLEFCCRMICEQGLYVHGQGSVDKIHAGSCVYCQDSVDDIYG